MKNLHSKHDTLPKTTVSLTHDKAYRCSAQIFSLSLSIAIFQFNLMECTRNMARPFSKRAKQTIGENTEE